MSINPSDLINPEPPMYSRVTAQLELVASVYTSVRDDWNSQSAAPVRIVFDQFGAQALFGRRNSDATEPTCFLTVRIPDGSMDNFVQAISKVPGVISAAPTQLARLM
jgi:hypothetical protein